MPATPGTGATLGAHVMPATPGTGAMLSARTAPATGATLAAAAVPATGAAPAAAATGFGAAVSGPAVATLGIAVLAPVGALAPGGPAGRRCAVGASVRHPVPVAGQDGDEDGGARQAGGAEVGEQQQRTEQGPEEGAGLPGGGEDREGAGPRVSGGRLVAYRLACRLRFDGG